MRSVYVSEVDLEQLGCEPRAKSRAQKGVWCTAAGRVQLPSALRASGLETSVPRLRQGGVMYLREGGEKGRAAPHTGSRNNQTSELPSCSRA